MRQAALALFLPAVLLLSGCAKSREVVEYRDPDGRFAVTIPKAWPANGDVPGEVKKVGWIEWVGSPEPQDEGEFLGAVLRVVLLDPSVADAPDGEFDKELDYQRAPFHGGGIVPLRVTGFVVPAKRGKWLVEFRAERKQYDAHVWAYAKAKETFRLL